MPEPKTISIMEGGERWSASYELDDRGVCVSSAYGSDRAVLGRKVDPEVRAKEIFKGIVRARLSWRR